MKYIFLSFLIIENFCSNAQLSGCPDSLANNYFSEAIINDGTCTHGSSAVLAAVSYELPEIMEETSEFFYWNDKLLTHNDDSSVNLYSYDIEDVANFNTYGITGTQNID